MGKVVDFGTGEGCLADESASWSDILYSRVDGIKQDCVRTCYSDMKGRPPKRTHAHVSFL